jgi:choline dehydrogenase
VLPSFRRLETDLDNGHEPAHGDHGPIPVRRNRCAERSEIASAVTSALVGCGVGEIEDHNAPGAVGVGPVPTNAVDGRRVSSAAAYLDPVRARPSLTVVGDSPVRRVVLRDGRAQGVRLADGTEVAAGEVVLSAGTYLTPQLLWASGVTHPDLGHHLVDHPAVSVDLPYVGPPAHQAWFQVVATLHSSMADPEADAPDLQVLSGGPFPQDDGTAVWFVGAALLRPRSRGEVGSRIRLGYYEDPEDLLRMLEGLALVERVIEAPAVRRLTGGGRLTPDLPTPTARFDWLRSATWTYHHAVGTCGIGRVLDDHCRVEGVAGLSVVDASALPDVPSANTHLPVTMLAERVVELW